MYTYSETMTVIGIVAAVIAAGTWLAVTLIRGGK